jgi:inositol transport system ATP-binding protein
MDMMTSGPAESPIVLEVRNLSKAFPGVQALDKVGLDVRAGEIHAVTGENGAGKSTLMRILAGLEKSDGGEILLKGRPCRLRSAQDAMAAGIAMIHQELMPFPNLSVAENIFMGRDPAVRALGWVNRRKQLDDAKRLLELLGVDLPPAALMRNLAVSEMQMVEIARAVASQAEIIIMDEPTSAISTREADALFRLMRDLQRRGVALIYISHKLEEIFRMAGRVTVLRDGRHICTEETARLDRPTLIARMVGREMDSLWAKIPSPRGEVALAVSGLTKAGKFRDISFTARRGEILGLAGLMGAGRTAVLNAIYGLFPAETGEILVFGRRALVRSPRDAIARGIGLVSEDRKTFGIVPGMSVKSNITLPNLRRCCRAGFIRSQLENRLADERIRAFGIKPADRNQVVNFLSGGNQQKVVIAKALFTDPQIILLDEPTRGIDIAAKMEVYAIISRLAGEGRTIILASSELPEILAMSDRILVMREGALAAELDPRQSSQEDILRYAMPN